MAGDRPRQPAYMKFLALNVDFGDPSIGLLVQKGRHTRASKKGTL